MIMLKIQKKYFTIWQRLKFLFGVMDGVVLKIPNITMEENESLIIHSFKGSETTVAVKSNGNGSLRVLFAPPSVDTNFIDVENGVLDIEPELKERIKGN